MSGRPSWRQVAAGLAERDPVVAGLVDRHGPPRITKVPTSGRFASLARSIVFQQLAGSAASAIHGRLVAYLGDSVSPEAVLAHGVEDLMTCGLSRSKARALRDLAARVAQGQVRLERLGRLSDDQVVEHLTQVWGVGRWTAEMFLLFTLGRRDVWPLDDYGVRVGFAAAWELPETPSRLELDALGAPFRPYRSVVAWYCWRAAEERPRAPTRSAAKG